MRHEYCDFDSGAYIRVNLRTRPVEVYDVFVPVAFRGKGIGRKLLKQVTADADRLGIKLTLYVCSEGEMTNAQLEAWYERNGFEPDINRIVFTRNPRTLWPKVAPPIALVFREGDHNEHIRT